MGKDEALGRLIEPVVTGLGYELVGLEHLRGRGAGLVRIFIDAPEGITLDDCERVSRQVSAMLDVEDPIIGAYTLEVSSPGVDRPLFTPEHYARHVGQRVRVMLRRLVDGRRKLTGTLCEVDAAGVVVEDGGERHRVEFDDIERAKLMPVDDGAQRGRRAAS